MSGEVDDRVGAAFARAVHACPGSTALVIRAAPWGATAHYEWSATGPDTRGPNRVTKTDELDELVAAIKEAFAERWPEAA